MLLQPTCLWGCGDTPYLHPMPSWAQLCWVPTPGRMHCAGAGQGCPPMRFLGSNLSWVASQKRGDGSWAGKGGGSRGSPSWQLGTPLLEVGGSWGCLSLHWLQGEPRHRAKL